MRELQIDEETVAFQEKAGGFVTVQDYWGMSVMLLPDIARETARWILDNVEGN